MISARISKLNIRGFRRFQEPKSFIFKGPDRRPPATLVVAGPNGHGKTSFFEAILYALGRERLIHTELDLDHHQRWLQSALTATVQVKLTLEVSSAPNTILGTRTPCSVEIVRSPGNWAVSSSREDEEAQPLSDDAGVIDELIRGLPVAWFSSWRQPYLCGPVRPMSEPPTVARGEADRLCRVKQRIIDERTRSAFTRIAGRDARWIEVLNRAWSTLRGDDGTSFTTTGANIDQGQTHFDLWIQRKDPEFDDLAVCRIDQLSSGELEWLALVGTLITEDFNGIVLIDEPELHLHPEWQARILPALRAVVPESQLVLATHADPPWDQVFSFERVLLVPPGDPREKAIR